MEVTQTKVKEQWKQRRSRSTSNLVSPSGGGGIVTTALKSDTDEGEMNDSDEAQRSLAKLTLQTGRPRFGSRTMKIKSLTLTPPNMESDSVNELLSTLPHLKPSSQSCKRRRRYKRMAIDSTEAEDQDQESFKEPYQQAQGQSSNRNGSSESIQPYGVSGVTKIETLPMPSTSTGIFSHHHHHHHHHNHHLKKQKKKTPEAGFLPFEFDSGKRKRSGRGDKSSDSSSGTFPLTSCPTEFQSMIGIGMDLMNVDDVNEEDEEEDNMMKGDDEDVSSVSSGADSVAPSCDEGREADDEQSDWIGEEESLGEPDRREFILRRLRLRTADYVPSREIRAGKRRVHPEIPPFSMRTYANEQVSKFLQDPAQSQLRLLPMRREERVQLSHIASLYSLHLLTDDKGGCPVLTKTSNTTQVSSSLSDTPETSTEAILSDQLLMDTESDSKRIKK